MAAFGPHNTKSVSRARESIATAVAVSFTDWQHVSSRLLSVNYLTLQMFLHLMLHRPALIATNSKWSRAPISEFDVHRQPVAPASSS